MTTDSGEAPLDQFITGNADYADFLPALRAADATQGVVRGGIEYPPQRSNAQGAPSDPVAAAAERMQKQRDARPNPLLPKGA